MTGPIVHIAALLASVAALAHGEATEELMGKMVVIRKVGYPEALVGERTACGQRNVWKSAFSPDYIMHVAFGGFHEGTCAQIGYPKFEKTEVIDERPVPFFSHHNNTVEVFSRDPTVLDVAGCIGRECGTELSALGSSHYMKDVAHCISPAFGPCVPKAWDCLGDDVCRSALQCLPTAAQTCGKDVWKVVTDPVERKKVSCIWQCGNSTACILEKCGKVALECFTGFDPVCHKAAVCLPDELLKCSAPAFKCLVSKDGVCRENLSCLAKGAGVCADPAVNVLTDQSIAGVMTCANHRCPAPAGVPNGTRLQGLELAPPSHYPEQLACMGFKCAGEVARLLGDKDVWAMTTCLANGAEGCGDSLWECVGDGSCQRELQCWTDSLVADSSDIWKMVTDPAERSFDRELVTCMSECNANHKSRLAKAFCVAGKCGVKAMKCAGDSTCRGVFTDLPAAVLKCAPSSLKDPKFTKAARCAAQMADTCGRAGIELVRDQNLAKIVTCNAQCTRPTQKQTEIVV